MSWEPFMINPKKKKAKRKAKAKAKKKTRSRRKRTMGIGREGTRHRPVVYTRRGHWTTSQSAKIARPGRRVNPFGGELMTIGANPARRRRSGVRRRRSNPLSSMQHLLPQIASGAVGAFAVQAVPKLIGVSGIPYYGVQAAVVVGGGWAVEKTLDDYGDAWMIGSASMMLAGVIQNLLGTALKGLGLDFDEEMDSVGALPGELSALPGGDDLGEEYDYTMGEVYDTY